MQLNPAAGVVQALHQLDIQVTLTISCTTRIEAEIKLFAFQGSQFFVFLFNNNKGGKNKPEVCFQYLNSLFKNCTKGYLPITMCIESLVSSSIDFEEISVNCIVLILFVMICSWYNRLLEKVHMALFIKAHGSFFSVGSKHINFLRRDQIVAVKIVKVENFRSWSHFLEPSWNFFKHRIFQ